MNTLKNVSKTILALMLLLLTTAGAKAQDGQFHSINVHVLLKQDGTAHITQTWEVSVYKGSEMYLPQTRLGDMEIEEFAVTDETGTPYEFKEKWDVNAKMEKKAGKCGFNKTKEGLELCWGTGSYGKRTYNISYTLTNLVKSYTDFDGFCSRFVNDYLPAQVDSACVTIEAQGRPFLEDEVKMWAFGHKGNIHLEEGKIVARTTAPLAFENHITIMLQFNKGIFQPTSSKSGSFEALKERNFAGSDYIGLGGIRSIEMVALLKQDGSAHITETWSVENVGISELHILRQLSDDMEIKEIAIADTSGQKYEFVGNWDSEIQPEQKLGKYGFKRKGEGVELYWGAEPSGEQVYMITYTLTNLMKSYTDFDGFDCKFICPQMHIPVNEASIIIEAEGRSFTEEDVKFWAYNHSNKSSLVDGKIIAKSRETMNRLDYISVILQIQKGIFQPVSSVNQSLEEIVKSNEECQEYYRTEKAYAVTGGVLSFLFGALILFVIYRFFRKMFGVFFGKQVSRSDYLEQPELLSHTGLAFPELTKSEYCRDVPFGGSIAAMVCGQTFWNTAGHAALLNACMLDMIRKGALSIHSTDKGGANLQLKIGNNAKLDDRGKQLHQILESAAGSNGILESKELNKWIGKKERHKTLYEWINAMYVNGREAFVAAEYATYNPDEKGRVKITDTTAATLTDKGYNAICQSIGFAHFLSDFTLINERTSMEVGLWDEYLIFATLLGTANQVSKEMRKLNPDFPKLSSYAGQNDLNDVFEGLALFSTAAAESYADTVTTQYSSSGYDGGGGDSSCGGGSDYDGGGSGGGWR